MVSELSTSVILSKMFAFSTPDITDNIQPFFVRSEASPRPDEISLATFVPQDDLSELVRLVEHFPGKWNALSLTLCGIDGIKWMYRSIFRGYCCQRKTDGEEDQA